MSTDGELFRVPCWLAATALALWQGENVMCIWVPLSMSIYKFSCNIYSKITGAGINMLFGKHQFLYWILNYLDLLKPNYLFPPYESWSRMSKCILVKIRYITWEIGIKKPLIMAAPSGHMRNKEQTPPRKRFALSQYYFLGEKRVATTSL